MTDIEDVLEHAVDLTIPVDLPADLARGRARVRRERRWLAGGLTAAVLILAPVGASLLAGGQEPGPSGTDPGVATQDASSPTSTPTPTPAPTPTEAPPGQTQFYAVPPPPAGWHVVGDQPEYVMLAPNGTHPSLTGGFAGKLVVLMSPQGFPQDHGTPVRYEGRTFYQRADQGSSSFSVQTAGGDWLTAQYPPGAFDDSVMLAFLDAVKPLAGATGAS